NRIPNLFYAAIARHPAPLTQAEMLDALCAGDILSNAAEALPIASRVLELGLFVAARDGTKTHHISDLALAKRIAASSDSPLPNDGRGALIDVASRRLQARDDHGARQTLKSILSFPTKKVPTPADIDDLQRRAALGIAYLRAGRTPDRDVLRRLQRVASRARNVASNDHLPLRLR